MKRNIEQAKHWYEEAAQKGDTTAQYSLALIYGGNYNFPVNRKKAFALFKQAANKGHVNAQAYLGYYFENGFGVEQNFPKSIYFFKLREVVCRIGLFRPHN